MNILIIQGGTDPNLPSGEKIVILNEQEYLSKNHNVTVEYIEKKKSVLGKLTGLIWSFSNYFKIIKLIEKHNPDLIHFHTIVPYLSLSVLYAAKKKKVKTVQTLHNVRWLCIEGGYFRKSGYCDSCVGNKGINGLRYGCGHGKLISFLLLMINFFARSNGRLFKLVDRFVAVSEFVKEQHVKSGFPEDKIVVRNNGIKTNLLKKSYSDNSNERRGVAYAGRVSVAKGSNVLKYLIARLKDDLHIVGSGPKLNELKIFCRQNDFKHVKFWGKQTHEKTLEILSSVICTVVPSQCGEAFSLVAAESMIVGTPVIASKLGGLADLIKKSKGGIVIEEKDFKMFYMKTEYLLNNRNYAKKIGEIGRDYVRKELSCHLKGLELENIYINLLK
tara:strand:+ start:4327 stop:5487 length:1161 start_codon:yes stop_codon:yes gene_type:complete